MRPNFKKGWVSPTNSMENPWKSVVFKGSQGFPMAPRWIKPHRSHFGQVSVSIRAAVQGFAGLLGDLFYQWNLATAARTPIVVGRFQGYIIYIYYIYIIYIHIKCQQLWNFRSSPFSDKPLRCKNRVERKAHTSELHAAPVFWYRHSAMEGKRIVTISAWSLSLMLQ